MAQRGVPLREIAGFLGHTDTCMVEKHYAHYHPDYQRRPAAAIAEALAEVRFVPQLHPKRACGAQPVSANALTAMVGAAGIEPATPTMST